MTVTPADPISASPPRHGLVTRLAAALDGLARRLGLQRDSMLDAAALAPRAEEAAIRARLLAFGSGGENAALATALAADIGTLAMQAGSLAGEAERVAEAGAASSDAIASHAAALAGLAADPDRLGDGSALRRILAPLVGTLEALPAQRRDQGAIGTGLARLAETAMPLAQRAERIAGQHGAAAGEEALRLSRELGALASAAQRIAAEIEQEGGSGEAIANAMAGELRDIARTDPIPLPPVRQPVQLGAPPPKRSFGKAPVWQGVSRLE